MVVSIERDGDIAIVTVDNPPVNALSQAVRQGLWDAAEALDADADLRGVVLTCAGRTFIAGADVREFGKPPEPPHLPELINRIERADKPWAAAIHGTALGGGFEVALGCRLRLAAPDSKVGLPEVGLGIVPGAGGTVRLPRLIAVEEAIAPVTGGKPVPAPAARDAGMIDALIDGDLRRGAVAHLRKALDGPLPAPVSQRAPVTTPDAEFWSEQEKAVGKRARGQKSPLRALGCLRKAVEADFATALAHERATFLELRDTDQARALRHVFFSERAAPRPPELRDVEPRKVARIGVVGGGTMGAGIAAAALGAGWPVTLVERDEDAAHRAHDAVAALFDAQLRRGRLSDAARDERMQRASFVTGYDALAEADLVIEAVFEDIEVKRAVFTALDAACKPDAVLATNTSYLDPNAIAGATQRPERVLALHFFSPAHVMKLLEIVPAAQTAPEVLATGFAVARRLGKVPVRAGICDGFIGNRILKVMRAQAERLLLAGATPADIDGALRSFGFAMGPFETQDLGGLDIAAFQRKAARSRGEEVFAPVADRLVAENRLGQKTGGGWYDYAEGDRTARPSGTVQRIIEAEAARAGLPSLDGDGVARAEAVLFAMVDEGARILDEGIAQRAADIDLVMIHGYGFPRWRGGLMHWAETRGLSDIVERLRALQARDLAPAPGSALVAAAQAGGFAA